MKQFDFYLVRLDPVEGSEQRGTRPCIVLQSNATSNAGRTTLIAPLTSKKLEKVYAYELLIAPSVQNGITEYSKLKLDQVRVVDKNRLIKKLGTLEETYWDKILQALDIIFDRGRDFSDGSFIV